MQCVIVVLPDNTHLHYSVWLYTVILKSGELCNHIRTSLWPLPVSELISKRCSCPFFLIDLELAPEGSTGSTTSIQGT